MIRTAGVPNGKQTLFNVNFLRTVLEAHTPLNLYREGRRLVPNMAVSRSH